MNITQHKSQCWDKHEPVIITTDHAIRCLNCGELLSHAEETIAKTHSIKVVKRMLEEIAVGGSYQAVARNEGFVVYERKIDGLTETITASKTGARKFAIVKQFAVEGGE